MISDTSPKPTVAELFSLLLNASAKAYEASWLKQSKEVYRDSSGRFASKDGAPSVTLTTPDETERDKAFKENRAKTFKDWEEEAYKEPMKPLIGAVEVLGAMLNAIPSQSWSPETKEAVAKDVKEGFALIGKQDRLNTQDKSNPRAYLFEADTLIDSFAKKASPGALMFAEMVLADICLTPQESFRRKNKLIDDTKEKALRELGELEKNAPRKLSLGETLRKGIKDAAEAVKKGLKKLKVEADKKLKEFGLDDEAKAIGDFAKSQVGNVAFAAQTVILMMNWTGHLGFIESVIASHAVHDAYRLAEESKAEEAKEEFRKAAEKEGVAELDDLITSLSDLKRQTASDSIKPSKDLATRKMLALHKQLHSQRQAENIADEFKKANANFIAGAEGKSATGEVSPSPDELIERAMANAEAQAEEEVKEVVKSLQGVTAKNGKEEKEKGEQPSKKRTVMHQRLIVGNGKTKIIPFPSTEEPIK